MPPAKTKTSREAFIKTHGATCDNWTWSWSFINEKEKFIIFGAWDNKTDGTTTLIFSESWRVNNRKRKSNGYNQSREHIRLIQEEGYTLKTFPILHSDERKDKDGIGPSVIKKFVPLLTERRLTRVGGDWYASDEDINVQASAEVLDPDEYWEGALRTIVVNAYERNPAARAKCIGHYGYKCVVCGFDFEQRYGAIGQKHIHVHHVVPLATVKKQYRLDPIKDLRPVCPNCHSMIHRKPPGLAIEQLKEHLQH